MDLGYLVQFGVEGSVLLTSGVRRKVVNSFVYGLPDRDLSFTTKADLGANFHAQAWAPIAAVLNAAYVGSHLWVIYPNTPGDAPQDVMVPASGAVNVARLPLSQAVFVALQTGERTRPYRGSKRFGPVNFIDTAGDELTDAGEAEWVGALGPLTRPLVQFVAHEAITLQPVVWSRVLSAQSSTVPPAVGAVITGFQVLKTLSQWRHRKERTVL